jgi:hypothetical protein
MPVRIDVGKGDALCRVEQLRRPRETDEDIGLLWSAASFLALFGDCCRG